MFFGYDHKCLGDLGNHEAGTLSSGREITPDDSETSGIPRVIDLGQQTESVANTPSHWVSQGKNRTDNHALVMIHL